MPRYVSATYANRRFSEVLGQAARGETVVITKRGAPVAQMTRFEPKAATAHGEAWDRLMKTLEEGLPGGGAKFNRDELYDR